MKTHTLYVPFTKSQPFLGFLNDEEEEEEDELNYGDETKLAATCTNCSDNWPSYLLHPRL